MPAGSIHRLRKAHRHPELSEQTIWEAFEAERPKLVLYAGRFDGFKMKAAVFVEPGRIVLDDKPLALRAGARP